MVFLILVGLHVLSSAIIVDFKGRSVYLILIRRLTNELSNHRK